MAEPMFSKAGKGYNREEVDAYLLELNRSFSEKEASLQDEIKKLTASLADAERRNAETESAFKAKEEQLTAAYKQKEDECSSMMASIGQRLMLADDRAEKIVADANAQADEIIADAYNRADAMCKDALMEAQKKSEKIIEQTKNHCVSFEKAVEDIKKKLIEVQCSADKTQSLMNSSLDSARNLFPFIKAPAEPQEILPEQPAEEPIAAN